MKKLPLPTLPVPPELATEGTTLEHHFPPGQRLLVTILDLQHAAAKRLIQGTYVDTQRGNVQLRDRRGRRLFVYCTDRYKVIITPVRGFLRFTLP